nr:NAD(P)-dependent oxidoreductase [Ligilactobacillus salitolerans]
MKIVIADYQGSMMPTHKLEQAVLQAGLPDAQVVVYEYHDEMKDEFYQIMADVDALLTGFIHVDAELLAHAAQLKVVSVNATGYDNVDLDAARVSGVGVACIGEYCTEDVAEFTLTQMLALVKNVQAYVQDVEERQNWNYAYAAPRPRLSELTLGIFGLGKIGLCVAQKARALGMRVLAYDPYTIQAEAARQSGVKLCATASEVLTKSDVITNHMNLNETNVDFFDAAKFGQMARQPYFLNMARGGCVVERDLVHALDSGQLKGAALDVLADEQPRLAGHPLLGRENVLVTPHAAFYSQTSLKKLQEISCQNIVHYLKGETDLVFKLVK